jgi:hypothetical protein
MISMSLCKSLAEPAAGLTARRTTRKRRAKSAKQTSFQEEGRSYERAGYADDPGFLCPSRGQQRPVNGLQPGTWGLPPQDGQLMAEDEELQVLGGVAAGEQHQRLDGAAQREVGQFRQHRGDL